MVGESFSLPVEQGVDLFLLFLPASTNGDGRSEMRSFRQITISLSDTTVFSVKHFILLLPPLNSTIPSVHDLPLYVLVCRANHHSINNLTMLTPSSAQTEIRPSVPSSARIRHKPPSDKSDKLAKAEGRSQQSAREGRKREGEWNRGERAKKKRKKERKGKEEKRGNE